MLTGCANLATLNIGLAESAGQRTRRWRPVPVFRIIEAVIQSPRRRSNVTPCHTHFDIRLPQRLTSSALA
jgi:hypothetical protein